MITRDHLQLVVIALASIFALIIIFHISWMAYSLRRARRQEEAIEGWSPILRRVRLRRATMHRIVKGGDLDEDSLKDLPEDRESIELSATDLFVEKVQSRLTERGDNHHILGLVYGHTVLVVLLLTGVYLLTLAPFDPDVTATYATARILSTAGIIGLCLAVAFFLASLARSHLHEATVLYNRRHMVRLGRLFLYLKFAGLKDLRLVKAKESLTAADMERAFGSIHETSTAFKMIQPEVLTNTPLGNFTKAVSQSLRPKEP